MKTTLLCLALAITMISFALQQSLASSPPAKKFHLEITFTGIKGLDHPLPLNVPDGKPATFQAGSEIPDDAGDLQYIFVGVEGKIRVHELSPDQWRVSISATQSDHADAIKDPSNILIPVSGIHCLRTIKPGETIDLDLGSGHKITFKISSTSKRN
ncbi:MAG TPA: hypothetical protein VFE58_15940 [Tepidisphaeraceae bacterium]|jgi:hypothetical protein|nr:hypothetical protein [Tepidisphaeraceae bacterium]